MPAYPPNIQKLIDTDPSFAAYMAEQDRIYANSVRGKREAAAKAAGVAPVVPVYNDPDRAATAARDAAASANSPGMAAQVIRQTQLPGNPATPPSTPWVKQAPPANAQAWEENAARLRLPDPKPALLMPMMGPGTSVPGFVQRAPAPAAAPAPAPYRPGHSGQSPQAAAPTPAPAQPAPRAAANGPRFATTTAPVAPSRQPAARAPAGSAQTQQRQPAAQPQPQPQPQSQRSGVDMDEFFRYADTFGNAKPQAPDYAARQAQQQQMVQFQNDAGSRSIQNQQQMADAQNSRSPANAAAQYKRQALGQRGY